MNTQAKIFVAGHRGLVGSALVRCLRSNGFENLLLCTHAELDLTRQKTVEDFFQTEKPDYVFLAAAKVGGIYANNTYPADFIYKNMMIAGNVVEAAYRNEVKRLLFLGSSCIYPKAASQPMREEALLGGFLESTNEPYAISKIAGIKLCESYNRQYGTDYRSLMPTNLYGPEDNFHPLNSHVIPGLLRRFHEACRSGEKRVDIWGSGQAKREFLHVDDLAKACVFVMQLGSNVYSTQTQPMLSHLNVGSGEETSIRELAETVRDVTGFSGELHFDASKPDGTPRKLLDSSKLNTLGWRSEISLRQGLQNTYQWYKMQNT